MPFRGRHISIWEHAAEAGRYYAMPLAAMVPESARTYFNFLVQRYEVEFDMLMWTLEARAAVHEHLRAEGREGPQGEGAVVKKIDYESVSCSYSYY